LRRKWYNFNEGQKAERITFNKTNIMDKNAKIKMINFLFIGFLSVNICLAAESENYKINADVLSVGGDAGSSENYKLTDTLGEPVVGIGASENYKSKAGFWPMVNTAISLVVNSNAINLGSHTPGTPITGNSIITVTTDSWGGYDLLASEDHNLLHEYSVATIPDYSCAINAPCLWSGTGLGFTVASGTGVESKWGSDPNFKYAYFPESDAIFHIKTGYTSGGDETEVEYKLDTPTTQKSGSYSNTITYTAISKL